MIRLITSFILFMVLIAGVSSTSAQQTTSGMQFLKVGPSAHSLSISQAHTGVNLGAASVYSNPAMLTRSELNTATGGYTLWLGNTSNSHASVNLPRENDAFGIGLLSSVVGNIEQRNQPGEPLGTFDVNYLSVAGSYARRVGPVSLGVTAMYLNELLFNVSASGYAFNLGAATTFLNDRISAGTVLLNLGEMQDLDIDATPLPTTFKAGIDADIIQFSVSETDEIPVLISLSSDFIQPLNDQVADEGRPDLEEIDDWFIAAGISAEIAEIITLRGGYRTGHTIRPISLGGSLMTGQLTFDYAFVPFDPGYQAVHSVAIRYDF